MYEQVNPNVLIFHRTDWLLAETGLSFILIFDSLTVLKWPGRAKHDSRLLAEKLSFAELRYREFRQHPQWPVLAQTV